MLFGRDAGRGADRHRDTLDAVRSVRVMAGADAPAGQQQAAGVGGQASVRFRVCRLLGMVTSREDGAEKLMAEI